MQYQIKSETADMLRDAAPRFGLVASQRREIIAPGIEALHLKPFDATAFDLFRKEKKISADAAIRRLVK